MSGRIGRQRRYSWARAPLADVKAIKQELDGTINDVVMAAISGGFRALLISRGEEPRPHLVRTLVPVSIRAPGRENVYENQISALLADLPVHIADPVERLGAVRAELTTLKERWARLWLRSAAPEIIPYMPIASRVRIGVSIFTNCDNVTFGITGDFRTSPDLDVIARGIEGGLAELLDAAGRNHRSAAGSSGERGKPRRLPTAGKHDPSTSERA